MVVVGIGGLDVAAGAGAEGSASSSCLIGDGGDEGRLDMTVGMEVPGGGAPLTNWSSLEPDMVWEVLDECHDRYLCWRSMMCC